MWVVPHSASAADMRRLVSAQSLEQRAAFYSLHAHMPAGVSDCESAVVSMNGMRLIGSSSGVFAAASWMNHSCAVSVHRVWRSEQQHMRFLVRCNITAGE